MLTTQSSFNQENEHLDTETRILEAAEKEFLTKGYAGARTTAIAEAAGVTHAMLHYYYRTKEKLFSKIMTDKIGSLAKTFVVPFEDDNASLEDCLRQGIDKHYEFVRANPDLPRFMATEVFNNPELQAQIQEKITGIAGTVVGRLQSKIDSEAAKGNCRQISAIEIMMDIISLNVFPVLAAPMIGRIVGENIDSILEIRKQSNIETILRKIRP